MKNVTFLSLPLLVTMVLGYPQSGEIKQTETKNNRGSVFALLQRDDWNLPSPPPPPPPPFVHADVIDHNVPDECSGRIELFSSRGKLRRYI